MKLLAKNFIQLWHLNISDIQVYTDWIAKYADRKYPNISYLAYFLNTKFEPSMIAKYFDITTENLEYTKILAYAPRTLDEFITLAQLSGVELYLK